MRTAWRRLTWCVVAGWLACCAPGVVRAQSQQEMNRDAERDFASADTELNKVYKTLCAKMEGEDLEELRAAQRVWVQFRDAQAKYEADLAARGGSMHPMVYESRRAELTQTRTADLRRLLKDEDGG